MSSFCLWVGFVEIYNVILNVIVLLYKDHVTVLRVSDWFMQNVPGTNCFGTFYLWKSNLERRNITPHFRLETEALNYI